MAKRTNSGALVIPPPTSQAILHYFLVNRGGEDVEYQMVYGRSRSVYRHPGDRQKTHESPTCFRDLLLAALDLVSDQEPGTVNAVDNLFSSLERLGFAFQSSRAAFYNFDGAQHCSRCHKEYDPRGNSSIACRVQHDHSESDDIESMEGRHQLHFRCCDTSEGWAGPSSLTPTERDSMPYADCYVGAHTTDANSVNYNGCHTRLCDNRCVQYRHCIYETKWTRWSEQKHFAVHTGSFRIPASGFILRHYFSNPDSDTFQSNLIEKLKGDIFNQSESGSAVDLLVRSLEELGFNFESCRQWLTYPLPLHCVRCREAYDPRENNATACIRVHTEAPECNRFWKFSHHGTLEYYFDCCSRVLYGTEDGPTPKNKHPQLCFVGHHVSDIDAERVPFALRATTFRKKMGSDVPMDIDEVRELPLEDLARPFKRLRLSRN